MLFTINTGFSMGKYDLFQGEKRLQAPELGFLPPMLESKYDILKGGKLIDSYRPAGGTSTITGKPEDDGGAA